MPLLAAALSLATMPAHGQQEDATPAPAKATAPDAAPRLERPADTDILVLRNGDKLAGSIVNDTFSLRTAYGQLKFERRLVAGIDLEGGPRGLESILTVNRNRFSGFLDNPLFLFQTQAGTRIEVRREKVLKAISRSRDKELEGIPQRQFVQLRNGDFFSGKILHDPFRLTTAAGVVEIRNSDIESITFLSGKDSFARIKGRDGKEREGILAAEDLDVELDVGPTIHIYQNHLDVLYARDGYVPANLIATTFQSPAAGSPSGQGPPRTEGKTMEGMVWIPAGEFTMGSPTSELERDLDEGPQTTVIIPHGFWMGKCEVTQAEYETVLGTNPSQFTGDAKRPVEKVSWYDALRYCARLTQLGETAGTLPPGYVYRLPTEPEWEYACRAKTTTRFNYGSDPIYLRVGDYAWFNGNSGSSTHPVGTKQPNAWGLFDLHGNVLEWCLDTWSGVLPGGTVTNAPAPPAGSLRVARGGSWLYEAKYSRTANRDDYSPSNQCSDLGFRIVLAPAQP